MFNFLRRPRVAAGPHEFVAETEIARPIAEMFPLIDLNSPSYWKRQMGDRVEKIAADTFEMTIAMVPDARFFMRVTDYEPGRGIAFEATSEPKMGRLERAIEQYQLTEFEPGMTRLELAMTVYFQDDLKLNVFEDEQVLLALSTFNAVEKIRLFAEEGHDAVHVADKQVVVGFDEIPCGNS